MREENKLRRYLIYYFIFVTSAPEEINVAAVEKTQKMAGAEEDQERQEGEEAAAETGTEGPGQGVHPPSMWRVRSFDI